MDTSYIEAHDLDMRLERKSYRPAKEKWAVSITGRSKHDVYVSVDAEGATPTEALDRALIKLGASRIEFPVALEAPKAQADDDDLPF